MLPLTPFFALATAHQSGNVDLVSLEQARIQDFKKVQDIRDDILANDPYAGVVPATLETNPEIKSMGLDTKAGEQQLQLALGYQFDRGVLKDYKPIDPASSDPVLDKTISRTDAKGDPVFMSLRDGLKQMKMGVYQVKVTETPNPSPGVSVNTPPVTMKVYVGVLDREDLVNGLAYGQAHPAESQTFKLTTEILDDTFIPVKLYDNSHGQLLAVLQKEPLEPLIFPDHPEFGTYQALPDQVKAAYAKKDMKSLKSQGVDWGVQETDGIVDYEHVRRKAYLALQALKAKVLAQHPAEQSDFPPEMLDTDEFKATGLRLDNRDDQMILFHALSYKPEGAPLQGYHPIDYAKDKAAGYSVVMTADGNKLTDGTVKDEFEGKSYFIYKLHAQSTKDKAAPPQDIYYGPADAEQLGALKKYYQAQQVDIAEVKDEDIPVSVYTNDDAKIAFVLGSKPKDLLLLPERPNLSLYVFTDSLQALTPLIVGGPDAKTVAQSLHEVATDYAFASK